MNPGILSQFCLLHRNVVPSCRNFSISTARPPNLPQGGGVHRNVASFTASFPHFAATLQSSPQPPLLRRDGKEVCGDAGLSTARWSSLPQYSLPCRKVSFPTATSSVPPQRGRSAAAGRSSRRLARPFAATSRREVLAVVILRRVLTVYRNPARPDPAAVFSARGKARRDARSLLEAELSALPPPHWARAAGKRACPIRLAQPPQVPGSLSHDAAEAEPLARISHHVAVRGGREP